MEASVRKEVNASMRTAFYKWAAPPPQIPARFCTGDATRMTTFASFAAYHTFATLAVSTAGPVVRLLPPLAWPPPPSLADTPDTPWRRACHLVPDASIDRGSRIEPDRAESNTKRSDLCSRLHHRTDGEARRERRARRPLRARPRPWPSTRSCSHTAARPARVVCSRSRDGGRSGRRPVADGRYRRVRTAGRVHRPIRPPRARDRRRNLRQPPRVQRIASGRARSPR